MIGATPCASSGKADLPREFGNLPYLPASKIRTGEPLARHTTLGIGGPADVYVEAGSLEDIRRLLEFVTQRGLPFLVLGGGSNVLFDDRGFRGVVMRMGPAFARIRRSGETLHAGAGTKLSHVLNHARRCHLTGLELGSGIPGTVGGALVMNAGTPQWRIGDRCVEVQALDLLGQEKRISQAAAGFGYRRSSLGQYLVLAAQFRLQSGNGEAVAETMARVRAQRRSTQPLRKKSAGCVFKNPPEESAGRLLDSLGLKGKRVGGAMVSRRHANFILNDGTATASDFLALTEVMRDAVRVHCGITLEQEVVQVTPWGIETGTAVETEAVLR